MPRLRVARAGDTHPQPGPAGGAGGLRIVVANVTALRPHIHDVLRVDADVVALVETRATAAGQRTLGAVADKAGWVALWGKPMPQRGTIWEAPAGGVAVLVRKGTPAKQMVLPPLPEDAAKEVPLARLLWESGRWMRVSLGTRQGKDMLELQLVYGVPGDTVRNAAFMAKVLDGNAAVGNLPKVLMGDFNVGLGSYRGMPAELQMALQGKHLVDVDAAYAERVQQECMCAYHTTTGGTTRIDGLLADPATASTVRCVSKVPDLHLPGHDPVLFELDIEGSSQKVRKVRKLQPPTAPVRVDMEPEQGVELSAEEVEARASMLVGKLLDPHMEEWCRLVAASGTEDVQQGMNKLWGLWTWLAEEVHIFVGEHDPEDLAKDVSLPDRRKRPKGKSRGRGTEKMIQNTTLKPQRRTTQGAPMTVPLRECGAASRALSAVLLWSRNRDRAQAGPGPMPLDMRSALRSVCKRVQRIQGLLPEEKLLEAAQSLAHRP